MPKILGCRCGSLNLAVSYDGEEDWACCIACGFSWQVWVPEEGQAPARGGGADLPGDPALGKAGDVPDDVV